MKRVVSLLVLALNVVWAQGLTPDQKLADFQYLGATYAKQYGPADWKRAALGVDILNLTPWLDKVRRTTTDLQFYDVMSEYVASFNDGHTGYVIPSAFVARLQFTVDIYDGKLLVDNINRARLPGAEYPFVIGYELVSIDGEDATRILDRLERYVIWGYARATRRAAASLITNRFQQLIPHAPANLPEISSVIFRRPDGQLETYRIPWSKSGLPLVSPGIIPPFTVKAARRVEAEPVDAPDYQSLIYSLVKCEVPEVKAVNGQGALAPVFLGGLDAGFTRRLGGAAADPFFSGIIPAGPYKIGFIRIPTYLPSDFNAAVAAFQREIAFFQANTDGLIIDETRNGGGSVGYTNALLSYLMPTRWRAIGFEIRATSNWVASYSNLSEIVKALGAPPAIVATYQAVRDELVAANAEGRLTKPVSLDGIELERDPLRDARGGLLAYTKPLMVLTDEFSASASEIFAAAIQDNERGILFGWRTPGAGGNVVRDSMGSFSQGLFSVTQSLMSRKAPVVTSEFPAAPYVENIGVRPDITADYMIRANLVGQGQPFVYGFTAAMMAHIEKNK